MTGDRYADRLYRQEIGDADGRIALFLNEQSARDLADLLSHDDLGRKEILDAIARAYPKEADDPEIAPFPHGGI